MNQTFSNSTYTPAYIGPFTLRNKSQPLYKFQCMLTAADARCSRELAKLLPLPDDKVTNDPISKPFSALKHQRKNAYAQVSSITNYHNALKLLSQYIEWLREISANPEDPWHGIQIYRVEKTTFDELKTAALFYKSYDTSQLKVGIHIPGKTECETEDFTDLFIEERKQNTVIVVCLAPFPKNSGYIFRNPYGIHEISGVLHFRINGVKIRLNGERKPAAHKVSMKNCSTDEAILRYEKENKLWKNRLYERLGTLDYFQNFFKKLTEITSASDDPWHNVPVHFVQERTFQKFVDNDKFYRYYNNQNAKLGVAMAEDTPDTRYLLLQQRRKRQCFMPDEIIEHERFSEVVLLICIPPIPKWPILKWD